MEGLRSWTVKYPGQKNPTEKNSAAADESSAWDAVVDRQANYLRNKRRLTRQPTALANDFVLENDKDYPRCVSVSYFFLCYGAFFNPFFLTLL